jgi:hypothetical protein
MCAENDNALGKWKHWIIWHRYDIFPLISWFPLFLTEYLEIKCFKLDPNRWKKRLCGHYIGVFSFWFWNFDYPIWTNSKFRILLITKDMIVTIILQPQSKNMVYFSKLFPLQIIKLWIRIILHEVSLENKIFRYYKWFIHCMQLIKIIHACQLMQIFSPMSSFFIYFVYFIQILK